MKENLLILVLLCFRPKADKALYRIVVLFLPNQSASIYTAESFLSFFKKHLDRNSLICYNNYRCESDSNQICERGGIGRRARLRGVW